MGQFVRPKVYLIGYPMVDMEGVTSYLTDTGQADFLQTLHEAMTQGLSMGEVLCSFYAKLCYKSLVLGKNTNVSRVRDIQGNLESCHDTGHGSVFEHANINFVVTNCSRVYTHEQVRHRVGVAYSQTSGRYCRLDSIDIVLDPILDDCKDILEKCQQSIEDAVYLMECRKGLRKPDPANPTAPADYCLELRDYQKGIEPELLRWVVDNSFDFGKRKKITSAIRRIAPNGQANEIGMTLNIRALRHLVQLRTQRFAEWEIRDVYNQIYRLTKARFPTLYHGAKERVVDGLLEVYGMTTQPYQEKPT